MFVLSGWSFNPTHSVLCLKSHIIFWSCTSEVENRSTSRAKRRFARQSDSLSPSRKPMPFDFCQRSTSSFSAIWSTILKSKLDKGSPCFVPSLSRTCRFLCPLRLTLSVPRIISSGGICNVSREVHSRDQHFDAPLTAFPFQQSVCCKMVQRVVRMSEPSLVFRLHLVESAVKSDVCDC